MESDEWERQVAAEWAHPDRTAEARIASMSELAREAPHASLGAFELGGAFDAAGRALEAAEQYEGAVRSGLSEVDADRMAQLTIQYSSTLRNLGRIDESIAMLEHASRHPSTGAARDVFLALTLRDSGRSDEALRVVIEALAPSLPRYRSSVLAYAAALTD